MQCVRGKRETRQMKWKRAVRMAQEETDEERLDFAPLPESSMKRAQRRKYLSSAAKGAVSGHAQTSSASDWIAR